MAVFRTALATRNRQADQFGTDLDAGSGSGRIEFRTGAIPATPELAQSAPTGAAVVLVVLQKPSTSAAAVGAETILDPASVAVTAAGDITWARAMDSAGNVVAIGDVSVKAGGTVTNSIPAGTGTFQIDATSHAVGSNIDFGAIVFTVPQG